MLMKIFRALFGLNVIATICSVNLQSTVSAATALTKRSAANRNPCATVSCYFNSMCEVDESTGEPICVCPENECDGIPQNPICADGVTFSSLCHVRLHMCKAQRWMTIQHPGHCGEMQCSSLQPCLNYGRCVLGVCSCVRCRDVRSRRRFPDLIEKRRRRGVCGSDGVSYESECHLRYESCRSRTSIVLQKLQPCEHPRKYPVQRNVPIRSYVNHLVVWKTNDPFAFELNQQLKPAAAAETIQTNEFDDYESIKDTCREYELFGCLPARHSRSKFLGIYRLVPGKRHLDSPVYEKNNSLDCGKSSTYLSRYNSTRFPNGSWIVGSEIGSGKGWFGVKDASGRPQDITGTWYSTAGSQEKPWVLEPGVSGRCVGDVKKKQNDCNFGEERGPLGDNWQSPHRAKPLYEIKFKRPLKSNYYRPGKKIVVEIFTNNRARRFRTAYVKIENNGTHCGVPEVIRHKHKLEFDCDDTIIIKRGRSLAKFSLHFRAPPRGCIIFRALIKSVNGEIFYDDMEKNSLSPSALTRTICDIGHSV